MCRFAREEDTLDPIVRDQPSGITETGQPTGRMHSEVGAGDSPKLLSHLVHRRRGGAVFGHVRSGHDKPVDAVGDCEGTPENATPSWRRTVLRLPSAPTRYRALSCSPSCRMTVA